MWLLFLIAAQAMAAVHVCQPCHPAIVKSYVQSPMGRSFGKPEAVGSAQFTHAASGTRFQVRTADGVVYQRLERGGLSAEYAAAYRIGSGDHAAGYLVRVQNWLFQSPVSRYGRQNLWDVAPGYEKMPRPDFNRRVTAECLGCHSSGPVDAPEAIGCEKCHGPAEQHLAKPGRGTIRIADAQVCEQCHLTGEARIPNPGGQTVFVFDRPRDDLRVVSHVEQLALSSCAQGRLWCGTCHDPHGRKVDVSAKCRECHAALPASHKPAQECTSCHMPKRDAVDGGHTAFTDHRIQRTASRAQGGGVARLRAWRAVADVSLAERNLGLALISVGERDGSAELINEGYKRLAAVFPKWEKDADVLASLGMVLFLKDQKADAVKLLKAAVAQRPSDAALHEKLAIVQRAAGDVRGGLDSMERAIAIDPARESAYHFLADWQNGDARRQVLERLLRVFPQSLIAREALAGR